MKVRQRKKLYLERKLRGASAAVLKNGRALKAGPRQLPARNFAGLPYNLEAGKDVL